MNLPTNLDGENRTKLLNAIKEVENQTVEVPVICGGEKVFTGKVKYQVAVSIVSKPPVTIKSEWAHSEIQQLVLAFSR